jgi:hypothetical protein
LAKDGAATVGGGLAAAANDASLRSSSATSIDPDGPSGDPSVSAVCQLHAFSSARLRRTCNVHVMLSLVFSPICATRTHAAGASFPAAFNASSTAIASSEHDANSAVISRHVSLNATPSAAPRACRRKHSSNFVYALARLSWIWKNRRMSSAGVPETGGRGGRGRDA